MSAELLEHQGVLVVVRCWCGVQHAIPSTLRRIQLNAQSDGRDHWVYCPLGHTHAPAGKSQADKLRESLEREQRRSSALLADIDQKRAEVAHQKRVAAAARGELTKAKRRSAAGVCTCCTRHFENLAAHMSEKHPEFCAQQGIKAKKKGGKR